MNYRFSAPARQEVKEAARWYRSQRAELERQFLRDLRDAIARMLAMPEAWGRLQAGTRRCKLTRFPYGLVYRHSGQLIEIVAVMHLHRRPGYWRDRL